MSKHATKWWLRRASPSNIAERVMNARLHMFQEVMNETMDSVRETREVVRGTLRAILDPEGKSNP